MKSKNSPGVYGDEVRPHFLTGSNSQPLAVVVLKAG